jgi:hypothetical protein
MPTNMLAKINDILSSISLYPNVIGLFAMVNVFYHKHLPSISFCWKIKFWLVDQNYIKQGDIPVLQTSQRFVLMR